MTNRSVASFAAISLAALCAALGPALAAGPEPLRLCADPDNLPLSSDKPATPGLYVEIGEADLVLTVLALAIALSSIELGDGHTFSLMRLSDVEHLPRDARTL